MTAGKNRMMIFGPRTDGTYVVEFRMADGEVLSGPPRAADDATRPRHLGGILLRAARWSSPCPSITGSISRLWRHEPVSIQNDSGHSLFFNNLERSLKP